MVEREKTTRILLRRKTELLFLSLVAARNLGSKSHWPNPAGMTHQPLAGRPLPLRSVSTVVRPRRPKDVVPLWATDHVSARERVDCDMYRKLSAGCQSFRSTSYLVSSTACFYQPMLYSFDNRKPGRQLTVGALHARFRYRSALRPWYWWRRTPSIRAFEAEMDRWRVCLTTPEPQCKPGAMTQCRHSALAANGAVLRQLLNASACLIMHLPLD